jgi:hypothetical protein
MVTSYAPDTNMKIICVEEVEEHATDSATDKAARPAVLREAPYFGLLDSPDAAPGREMTWTTRGTRRCWEN